MKYTIATFLCLAAIASAQSSTVSTTSSTWPGPVADPTYPGVTRPTPVDCGATFTACFGSNETEDCAAQLAACQGENPSSVSNTTTSTDSIPVTATEVVSSFTSTAAVPTVTSSAIPLSNNTLTTIVGSTKTGTGSSSVTTGGSKNGTTTGGNSNVTTTGTPPKSSISVYEGAATANTVGTVSLMAFLGAAALLL